MAVTTLVATLLSLSTSDAQDLFLARQPQEQQLQNGTFRHLSGLGGPPPKALDYCGVALQPMKVHGPGPTHVFAIGDWGGLDGTLWTNQNPPEDRARLISYSWGAVAGPSPFPRNRWNKTHSELLCDHKEFVECYESKGKSCNPDCGFVDGIDSKPQQLVAEQFKKYAALHQPKYVLNVGDNFYWGGIEKTCGTPMGEISSETRHQFDQVFEGVYNGPGLESAPWFSVLGNHDWGGRVFNNGWDQQIAYTWASPRWVMPAPYYSQKVDYVDQGFSVDLIFIDSNVMNAGDPEDDAEHNICSSAFNPSGASCAAAGGPASVAGCQGWFSSFWTKNQEFAEKQLKSSTADWQILVTHFPCGHAAGWYQELHDMGLDLLVTGHRHDQELWFQSPQLGGLTCFVTGGGGGISSEATPVKDDGNWYGEAQYGFYDLVISKSEIQINSIDYRGEVVKTATLTPN